MGHLCNIGDTSCYVDITFSNIYSISSVTFWVTQIDISSSKSIVQTINILTGSSSASAIQTVSFTVPAGVVSLNQQFEIYLPTLVNVSYVKIAMPSVYFASNNPGGKFTINAYTGEFLVSPQSHEYLSCTATNPQSPLNNGNCQNAFNGQMSFNTYGHYSTLGGSGDTLQLNF